MTTRPEFVDDVPAEPDGEHADVLDLGTSPRHDLVRRVGAVLGAATVLVAAVVAVVPHDVVVRGNGSSVRGAPVLQTAAPPAAATVRGLAGVRGPLDDYVRQTAAAGACPSVRVGTSPTRDLARRVRAALPGFTVTDVASSLDEFAELCSVRLRARDAHGVVLAVVVAAPGPGFAGTAPAELRTGTETGVDGTAVAWVSALTARGWTVVVGAVGSPAALPSPATLQNLVERGGLTW